MLRPKKPSVRIAAVIRNVRLVRRSLVSNFHQSESSYLNASPPPQKESPSPKSKRPANRLNDSRNS